MSDLNIDPIRQEIWALDMDRTLLDTDSTFDLFLESLNAAGVDPSSVKSAVEEVRQKGLTLDIFAFLRDNHLSRDDLEAVADEFIYIARDAPLLYGDAEEFLEAIDENSVPHLILTKGMARWQLAKLKASGLYSRPFTICSEAEKGTLISSWKKDDHYMVQAFSGELLVGHTVRVPDDSHTKSFTGLPMDCTGYFVNREGITNVSLPPNVYEVPNLSELIHLVEAA